MQVGDLWTLGAASLKSSTLPNFLRQQQGRLLERSWTGDFSNGLFFLSKMFEAENEQTGIFALSILDCTCQIGSRSHTDSPSVQADVPLWKHVGQRSEDFQTGTWLQKWVQEMYWQFFITFIAVNWIGRMHKRSEWWWCEITGQHVCNTLLELVCYFPRFRLFYTYIYCRMSPLSFSGERELSASTLKWQTKKNSSKTITALWEMI